jgi:2'-5' RNA ligase
MPRIRAFIALPTSSEVKQQIAAIQAKLIETQADVRWEGSERFHITLKFLGDCEPEVLHSLLSDLQASLRGTRSFELLYDALGCFPNMTRPRVVWVGAQENPQIATLQRLIEDACGKFGFAREERPFHAHITLGRVKGNRHVDRLTETLKTVTFEPLQARCGEIHLMRSELQPTGSVYSLLNSIPLLP